jgi:molybdopterin converting factor small subunit
LSSEAKITVRVRIMGPIDGQSVNASGTVFLKEGDTVKKLFKQVDAALDLKKQKPFRRAFKQGIRPVVLLNGDRIDLPQEENCGLTDGDEISVILAVAGG